MENNKVRLKRKADRLRRLARQQHAFAHVFGDNEDSTMFSTAWKIEARIRAYESLDNLWDSYYLYQDAKELSSSDAFDCDIDIAMDEITTEIEYVERLIKRIGEYFITRFSHEKGEESEWDTSDAVSEINYEENKFVFEEDNQ